MPSPKLRAFWKVHETVSKARSSLGTKHPKNRLRRYPDAIGTRERSPAL
jgi:hypothetical protein